MIDRQKYPPLNLPPLRAKVKMRDDVQMIFDPYRKKYIQLAPEEWVRQHFAQWLVTHVDVPASHLLIEGQVNYADLNKRPDIQVLDANGNCWMIVECKAPDLKLKESHWEQALTYFSVLNPKLLVISNGLQHIFSEFRPDLGRFEYIDQPPKYR